MSDRDTIRVRVDAEFSVPYVPDTIKTDTREVSIAEIDDADLRVIGEAWTQRLIELAHGIRDERKAEVWGTR